MHHDHMPTFMSLSARAIAVTLLALSLAACATQRYGRMTPVSPAERASLNCEQIALEIDKASFFITDVQRQRSETTGAHVLGALGDFGIGNVMEGNAAENSGQNRYHQLKALYSQKDCATTQARSAPPDGSSAGAPGASDAAVPCEAQLPDCTQQFVGAIVSKEDFEMFVVDRSISPSNSSTNLMIRSDGTMAGMLPSGATLSGPWYFDDGYFCREVIANEKSHGWDCSVVSIDGNEVTFTRKMGKGEAFKYVLN